MKSIGILFLLLWAEVLIGQNTDVPNIIIYLSDDHGAEDAGCLGNRDLKTPAIDQLAEEGMVFQRAYTPVSVCAPSRSVLFTGLYPHRNGCDRNHGHIKPGVTTLPDYLIPLGYKVVLAGKRHIKPETQFDFEYIQLYEVRDFLKEAGDGPFCLIIALNVPHQPYFNHKEGYQNIHPKNGLPETKETIQYTRAYYDHVNLLDHELGNYQYWVEKYNFSDALQIYISDHGPAFPFAKWSLYEQGIRIPFIVKWPGKIRPGTIDESLVSLVDVLPTLVDVAGGSVPETLDGQSLDPYFGRRVSSNRDYVFAAYTNLGVHGGNEYPIRAVISRDFKVIVNINHENDFHISRMDNPDNRALIDSYDVLQSWLNDRSNVVRQRAQHHWRRPAVELYDLNEDSHELNNLAWVPEYASVQQAMLDQLASWMEEQNDPKTGEIRKLIGDQKRKHK